MGGIFFDALQRACWAQKVYQQFKNKIVVRLFFYPHFININSTESVCNTYFGVFGISLDAVANIVDDIESNPDAFAYASDAEMFQ